MRLALELAVALALSTGVQAGEIPVIPLQGSAQVAFTPGDAADSLLIGHIARAKSSVWVQAYSFTHRAIAEALVAARQRGLDVRIIADPDQVDRLATSQVRWLAGQNVPVYLDGQHAAAHDKTMIIDAGQPHPAVITGSYNFTHAAQFRNAENLIILIGNTELTRAYADNWLAHLYHSTPLRP